MEIKSIKTIQNVGTFANFQNGAKLRFEKLTFIYGFNTYGKTTLTDIFQSIKDSDSSLISNRKTIPTQSSNQKIEINIKDDSGETCFKYENNTWNSNNLSKYLEIFGSEFIHRNLFTGLKTERENKENFTQFILGEDGVQQATEIATKKKDLGDKKRDIKHQVPHFAKDKSDIEIQKFLDISIDELDKEKFQKQLSVKQKYKQAEVERLKEPKQILNLPDIPTFQYLVSEIDLYIEKINEALKSDYSNIKEEIIKKIDQHILNSFKEADNALNWIKQGRERHKDTANGTCSFCGQSLNNAQELMNAYDLYFDEEYNKYITDIEKVCKDNLDLLEKTSFNYKVKIQDILTKILKYKELNKDDIFQKQISDLETKIGLIDEDGLNADKQEIIRNLKIQITEKLKKPYVSVREIDFKNVKMKSNKYQSLLNEIKTIIENLKNLSIEFKKQYKSMQVIQRKVESYDTEINILEMKIARISQNQECIDYQTAKNKIITLEADIPRLETELSTNQNNYLATYFAKIDKLFRRLGSRNFTLEQSTSTRGYSPVYFLEVKFHGQKINDENLKTVFSESDRRALALAVFWARIELKPSAEKSKTIVILDDPITSFDDNRITNSIILFKESLESLESLSQIIILTHYPSFLKSFCERTKESSITTKFFKIEKGVDSSKLEIEERETFTNSQYEKIFYKILGFIKGEHTNCIKTDLRPFLESLYLPTVFALNIKKALSDGKDLSSLDKTIDAIFTNETVKNKFHSFRNNLNPDAHIFTSTNPEDVRNFANDMMNYLLICQP